MICESLKINFELSKISNVNSGSESTNFVLHENALNMWFTIEEDLENFFTK